MARRKRRRNYKKEYRDYHAKPEQKRRRAKRNKARRRAARKGRVRKGDGKHVHHVKPLSKGGSNSPKNTRVVSARVNLKNQPKRKKRRKRRKK